MLRSRSRTSKRKAWITCWYRGNMLPMVRSQPGRFPVGLLCGTHQVTDAWRGQNQAPGTYRPSPLPDCGRQGSQFTTHAHQTWLRNRKRGSPCSSSAFRYGLVSMHSGRVDLRRKCPSAAPGRRGAKCRSKPHCVEAALTIGSGPAPSFQLKLLKKCGQAGNDLGMRCIEVSLLHGIGG